MTGTAPEIVRQGRPAGRYRGLPFPQWMEMSDGTRWDYLCLNADNRPLRSDERTLYGALIYRPGGQR